MKKLCLERVHWNMTPSAQDFLLSFVFFSFLVSGRQVLGQIPDTREKSSRTKSKFWKSS